MYENMCVRVELLAESLIDYIVFRGFSHLFIYWQDYFFREFNTQLFIFVRQSNNTLSETRINTVSRVWMSHVHIIYNNIMYASYSKCAVMYSTLAREDEHEDAAARYLLLSMWCQFHCLPRRPYRSIIVRRAGMDEWSYIQCMCVYKIK